MQLINANPTVYEVSDSRLDESSRDPLAELDSQVLDPFDELEIYGTVFLNQ